MKRQILLILALCAAVFLAGCGSTDEKKITFSDDKIVSDLIGVSIDGTTLTINVSGTYTLTGSCAEGNIIIDAPDGKPVNLILDDLNLTSSKTSPIVVRSCSMAILTLKEKTQNIITDNHTYTEMIEQGEQKDSSLLDDAPDAAILSKCPLLIRGDGDGKLVVNANSYNGITSSDTLTIEGGVINVTAKNHALRGKDYLVISGGVLTIKAGEDGIKSTNSEKASLGYINIKGGVINVNAGDEAIYAVHSVNFTGGTITIKSKNTGIKSEGTVNFDSGIIDITSSDDPILSASQTLKEDALVTVNGKKLQP